jgi:hypothetical protein
MYHTTRRHIPEDHNLNLKTILQKNYINYNIRYQSLQVQGTGHFGFP